MANPFLPARQQKGVEMAPGVPQRGGLVDRVLGRKWFTSGLPGANAGWSAGGLSQLWQRGGLPRRLSNYLATFGGTEESVLWVYACVSLIMSEGAAYPYEITTQDGDQLEEKDIPEDLRALIKQPNRDMTYFDFSEYVYLDLELSGNSYWLKDEQNKLGQPRQLLRLRPDMMQVAVDKADQVIGYVYNVQGIQIPYDLSDLVRFRYPHPVDTKYGMGTVEAIQRTLGANLAEDAHVAGFFTSGARLSGILTTAESMSEPQFERLKNQFKSEFGVGGSNRFGVMVAEQGNSYTPVSVAPGGSGVIELKSMTKDEILSGFGIPEFLLGGAGQGGIYRMSEAQHIFSRTMQPKAIRFGEKMTSDLVSLWDGLEFRVDVTVTEPMEDKLQAAGQMLGRGASLNQLLDRMGLPAVEDENADRPIMQAGFVFFDQMVSLADQAVQQGQLGIDQQTQPPPDPFALDSGNGGFGNDPFGVGSDGFGPPETQLALPPGKAIHASRPGERARKPHTERGIKATADLSLPSGYERITEIRTRKADIDMAHSLLAKRARVFRESTDDVRMAFVKFFIAQRKRVVGKLPKAEKRAGTGHMRYPRKDVRVENIWDAEAENELIQETYRGLQETLGQAAYEDVSNVLGSEINWSLENPHVQSFLGETGDLIVRINDTTRDAIREQIQVGMQRGYSIPQIANGFEKEDYKGVAGVFDEATASRAETIARAETAMLYNRAAVAGYTEAGIGEVEVIDGLEWDDQCREANGETWTLEKAAAHPIEHPNCVRSFVPIVTAAKGVHVGSYTRADGTRVHAYERSGDAADAATVGGDPLSGQAAFRRYMSTGWVDCGGDIEKAVKALGEGKKVRLDQTSSVSTLLDKLAAIAQEAEKKGEKAPTYDLCKVSVPGTNLFCVESLGRARRTMPQLKGKPDKGSKADKLTRDSRDEVDVLPEFRKALKAVGVSSKTVSIKSNRLRASQSELLGTKVAGIMEALRSGKKLEGSVIISNDDYVVDGHHRWAAEVGIDASDGHLGDVSMQAVRIDLSITEILDLSNRFAKLWGLPQQSVTQGAAADNFKKAMAWYATLSDDERDALDTD